MSGVRLREENPVSLPSQHRNQIRFRVRWRVRLEVETSLISRPANGGSRTQKRSVEGLRSVLDMCCREHTIPFHIEGYRCVDWEDAWNGWSGNSQPLT